MAIFGTLKDLDLVFDKTEELEYLYVQIHSLFKADFSSQLKTLKEGESFHTSLKYGMFFVTHCYKLKDEKCGFFESHRQYIDFQVVLEGFERYLIGSKKQFILKTPYDKEKDLEIYSPKQPLSNLFLQKGEMCILFPSDVHGTGIGKQNELNTCVKKAVFKVPQTLIKHRL